MFEGYKNRMAYRGRNVSEVLRMQSNAVIEQTWNRDPNYRQVYVVRVDSGLPEVIGTHELIDVKFNVNTYQAITSDEVAYMLQFRHGEEKRHPEITIGSYVYMKDEDGGWKWWLICHLDERPQFRQYQILECNWTFGWVVGGKIYHCLGVQRVQQSYNSGAWDGDRFTFVDNITSAWMPTNSDTLTIGYDQRFLISDPRRRPCLAWSTSKIEDTQPEGLTKLKFTQETFNPKTDNAELMLADYYTSNLAPVESTDTPQASSIFNITYNGVKPTIKVGGSAKIFTAQLPEDNHFDIKWSVFDGISTYDSSYDNGTRVFGDYTITTEDRTLAIRIANNYNLIDTILTISAHCADGSTGSTQVEVVG